MTEPETLLDRILARRDREREEREHAMFVIRSEDALLETNSHATMRWYLHPELPGAALKSIISYRYELEPHSHTGKWRIQGNFAGYCINGYGTVNVNGQDWEWEPEDVIVVPTLREGNEIQLFNDSDETAMIMAAEPNFVDLFGVDVGVGFELLEDRGPE